MKSLDTYINEGLLTSKESPLFHEFTSKIPALLARLEHARDKREYYELSRQVADEVTKRYVKKVDTNVVPRPDTVYINWVSSWFDEVFDYIKIIHVTFNGYSYSFYTKDGKFQILKYGKITNGKQLGYNTGGPPYFKMDPVVSKEIIQTIELIYSEKS